MYDDAISAYQKSLDLGAGNIVLSALGCACGMVNRTEFEKACDERNGELVFLERMAKLGGGGSSGR